MSLISALKSLITKAGRAEGGRITGPLAPVWSPEWGVIPMSWPLNYWQCGGNVLPSSSAAIVDACIWAYIRAFAQLPGYQRRQKANGGTENVTTTALSRILRNPNPYMTPSDYLAHLIRSLLLTGNSYWLAERNDRQEVTALHWTNSRSVKVDVIGRPGQIGEVFYSVTDHPLIPNDFGGPIVVPARDVLHIKLETAHNPLIGESWLQYLAVELANRGAMSFATQTFFNNAGRPSGVLTVPMEQPNGIQPTADQVEELRQQWIRQTTGANAGGTPVLTRGIKWEQTALANENAELVEQLKLNDRMVCAVFGVPPVLIGLSESGSAVKTAEAEMQSWAVGGLGWLINHVEVAHDKFFALPGVQAGEYTEWDTQALFRTQQRDRIDALAKAITGGILSPNEARLLEGYGAVEAGDEPRLQAQVVPLSAADKIEPAPAAPTAPAANDGADDAEIPDDEARMIVLATHAKALQNYEARHTHR